MSSQPAVDPRATALRLASPALGVEKGLFVYAPPGHGLAGPPLPALYLLRGHEREWVNPAEDESRGATTVIDVYERLLARGEVGPMLLVMPGLASDDNRVPAMLTDFRAPDLADGAPGVGSGSFARYFFEDLIPFVEARFPAHPRARAVAGFSLGGYMALKAAALRPELFVSVGAYDGSFPYAADAGQAARPGDTLFAAPMFDPALGLPRDPDFSSRQNPICLLMRADLAAVRRITWLIQYGPEWVEPWGSNFYRGEHLLRALRALGVENAAPGAALPDGSHTWAVADRHIEQTLPLHWRALAAAVGPG